MVVSCVAYNCTQRCSPGTNVSFHRFPSKNPKLKELWIQALRRKDWEPTAYSRLCSKHFSEKDFIRKPGPKGGKTLKDDAVPLIFDFPAHIQRSASLFADNINFRDNVEEYQRTTTVSIENVSSITESSIEETPSEVQIPSCQPVACSSHLRKNDRESISAQVIVSSIQVEEMPQKAPETLQAVARTLQNPVMERTVKTNFEAGKMPSVAALVAQKIMDENRSLRLKNKQLERQLENYKKKEEGWKKRRNVLQCRLQRREKVLETLISVVSPFEEDTPADEAYARLTIEK